MDKYTQIKDGKYGDMAMPVFGNPRTAEKLVQWYEQAKNNPNHSNPKQVTGWGLSFTAHIIDDHPAVVIDIDEEKLQDLLDSFTRMTALHFTDHGITVTLPAGSDKATISVFSGDEQETFLPIHEFHINTEAAQFTCATIHVTDEGFVLERFVEREDVVVQRDELTAEA